MSCYPVIFDGHDLSQLFYVEHAERTLAEWDANLIEASSAIGSLFGGTSARPVNVQLVLTALDDTRDGRQEALRTLAGWLAVDSPRLLQMADEGGRYRMAVPTGNAPIDPYMDGDSVSVSFACPDPRLFGEERTVTVPSKGNVTFLVDGTAPTMPTVSVVMAAGADGQQWRLALEDGSYLLYEPNYSGAIATEGVTFDCAARLLTVDGYARMLPPTADWLTLSPGEHTLTMTSDAQTGDATVTYREMWW